VVGYKPEFMLISERERESKNQFEIKLVNTNIKNDIILLLK
jgi:hypothetical protein